MSVHTPLYRQGDLLAQTGAPGSRMLVLGVGHESYWLRTISGHRDGEPQELAWAIEGCEAATEHLLWPNDPRTAGG